MLCIIPILMVLSFFFNSRILQTGILQTGPNQFVENQKQNQDNTGRFGMQNLPKRLEFFFAETSCSLADLVLMRMVPSSCSLKKTLGLVTSWM